MHEIEALSARRMLEKRVEYKVAVLLQACSYGYLGTMDSAKKAIALNMTRYMTHETRTRYDMDRRPVSHHPDLYLATLSSTPLDYAVCTMLTPWSIVFMAEGAVMVAATEDVFQPEELQIQVPGDREDVLYEVLNAITVSYLLSEPPAVFCGHAASEGSEQFREPAETAAAIVFLPDADEDFCLFGPVFHMSRIFQTRREIASVEDLKSFDVDISEEDKVLGRATVYCSRPMT